MRLFLIGILVVMLSAGDSAPADGLAVIEGRLCVRGATVFVPASDSRLVYGELVLDSGKFCPKAVGLIVTDVSVRKDTFISRGKFGNMTSGMLISGRLVKGRFRADRVSQAPRQSYDPSMHEATCDRLTDSSDPTSDPKPGKWMQSDGTWKECSTTKGSYLCDEGTVGAARRDLRMGFGLSVGCIEDVLVAKSVFFRQKSIDLFLAARPGLKLVAISPGRVG